MAELTRTRSIRLDRGPGRVDPVTGDSGPLGGVDSLPGHYDGPRAAERVLILAPGAGAPHTSAFMTRSATGIADAGVGVLRFSFPYQARAKKAPDRAAILDSAWRRVFGYTRARHPDAVIVIGGKSMGGRYATHLLAANHRDLSGDASGGVLFGYPLHRPGSADDPAARRDEHLGDIAVPLLFFGGTRDSLARIDLMEKTVASLDNAELIAYDEASHDFAVPKRTGTTRDVIIDDMAARTAAWIRRL